LLFADLDDDFELHGSTHGANTNTAWSDKGRAYVYGDDEEERQEERGSAGSVGYYDVGRHAGNASSNGSGQVEMVRAMFRSPTVHRCCFLLYHAICFRSAVASLFPVLSFYSSNFLLLASRPQSTLSSARNPLSSGKGGLGKLGKKAAGGGSKSTAGTRAAPPASGTPSLKYSVPLLQMRPQGFDFSLLRHCMFCPPGLWY
jgi:hypothetical protein